MKVFLLLSTLIFGSLSFAQTNNVDLEKLKKLKEQLDDYSKRTHLKDEYFNYKVSFEYKHEDPCVVDITHEHTCYQEHCLDSSLETVRIHFKNIHYIFLHAYPGYDWAHLNMAMERNHYLYLRKCLVDARPEALQAAKPASEWKKKQYGCKDLKQEDYGILRGFTTNDLNKITELKEFADIIAETIKTCGGDNYPVFVEVETKDLKDEMVKKMHELSSKYARRKP